MKIILPTIFHEKMMPLLLYVKNVCFSTHLHSHVVLQHGGGLVVVGGLGLQLSLGRGHHCRQGRHVTSDSAAIAWPHGGLHVTRAGNNQGEGDAAH